MVGGGGGETLDVGYLPSQYDTAWSVLYSLFYEKNAF